MKRDKKTIDSILEGKEDAKIVFRDWFKKLLTEFANNGRQIRFKITSSNPSIYLVSTKIEGQNQSGQEVVWEENLVEKSTKSITTEGWWWKEFVDIQFQYCINEGEFISKSLNLYIHPQGLTDSVITFNCDGNSSHVD